MTRVTVDPATLERLRDVKEPVELCDESGRVLGAFTPAASSPPRGTTPETLQDREAQAPTATDSELNVYGRAKDLE